MGFSVQATASFQSGSGPFGPQGSQYGVDFQAFFHHHHHHRADNDQQGQPGQGMIQAGQQLIQQGQQLI